jgi:osmotically-inducible protein OsmY
LTYSAKDTASSVAWLVNGIQDVENRLHVQFSSNISILSDDEIQRNATKVLAWNADIRGLAISVLVAGGVVTQDGTVASYWQRIKSENLVSDLLGVVDVINQITVVPTELLTDQTVAENIQTALKNSLNFDGRGIKISVKDGIVRLKGFVSTSHDRMQAYTVAGNCRGVIDIINEIKAL